MNKKNEIETTASETTPAVMLAAEAFKENLQGAIGLSPLAVGKKFESDDLVKADKVTLWDFDWIDYIENEGTEKERVVHFSLWKTVVENNGVTTEGYYQGGYILNKLATHIQSNSLGAELFAYGIEISAAWDKTSSGNKILKISVV